MKLFSYEKTYNILKFKNIFLGISILLVVGSWVLVATKGLSFGIDFAGGTVVQVRYAKAAPVKKIREVLNQSKFSKASIQEFGDIKEIIIKIPTSSKSLGVDIGDEIRKLLKPTGNLEIRRVDMVGPKVGGELREKGLMALLIAIIGILIYVSIRFEWRFAIASVAALVHDISITVGVISLLSLDVNLDILAALLTILGYSLNDTIVVFDRIRETLQKTKKADLVAVINDAISKTLSRTTLTSLTTFFVVLTLFLFGGELIRGLNFTLMIGIIVGTYSSIFIAATLLKLFGFKVSEFKEKEARKAKLKLEKEKLRSQYEQGVV